MLGSPAGPSARPVFDSRSIVLRGTSEQGQHPPQCECNFCNDYEHRTYWGGNLG